jgi:hypothetical protein
MNSSYTANGKFLFKCKESMLKAVLSLENLGLISKCGDNYGLYADSDEFHAVNVIDEEDLSFTLAFGVYDDLLERMGSILPLCSEWELDFYSFDQPLVGCWKNGSINLVDDKDSLLRLIKGVPSELASDAITMTIDEFENTHETSDYYEELERALQVACAYVWSKPNHLNQ